MLKPAHVNKILIHRRTKPNCSVESDFLSHAPENRVRVRILHPSSIGPGSALLVAENRPSVVEKDGREEDRWKNIREGSNLLNGWMKGLGRSGDV